MKETNLLVKIDVSGAVEALQQIGGALQQISRAAEEFGIAVAQSMTPALERCMESMTRAYLTTCPPFYRRWYFKAAYWFADRFPEWVSAW